MGDNFGIRVLAAVVGDPLTLLFSTLIIALFLFVVIMHLAGWQRALCRAAPSVLTSLGVLGTFAGIFAGLINFDVTNIDSSVPILLDGLKVAFITSIFGMSTAILFKVLLTIYRKAEAVGAEGPTAADLYEVMREIRDGGTRSAEETCSALERLRAGITGDQDSSLVTQLQKLRTTTADHLMSLSDLTAIGFARISEDFRDFARLAAEQNSKALIEALNEVIRDFNRNLTEQFGENFKHLNAAVERLVVWQEQYRTHVETLTAAFEMAKRGIEGVATAVGEIAGRAEAIPTTMAKLSQVLKALDAQTQDLARHLEAFASLREQAGQAFPIIEQNLAALTGSVTEMVRDTTKSIDTAVRSIEGSTAEQTKLHAQLTAEIKASVDQLLTETRVTLQAHQESHQQVRKDYAAMREQSTRVINTLAQDLTNTLQGALTQQSRVMEEHAAAMKDAVAQLRANYERTLQHSAEMLGKQVVALDEKMQEEVERVVTEMGRYLLSISNKFVQDYTPLTERLRDVLKIAQRADAR